MYVITNQLNLQNSTGDYQSSYHNNIRYDSIKLMIKRQNIPMESEWWVSPGVYGERKRSIDLVPWQLDVEEQTISLNLETRSGIVSGTTIRIYSTIPTRNTR